MGKADVKLGMVAWMASAFREGERRKNGMRTLIEIDTLLFILLFEEYFWYLALKHDRSSC